MTENWLDRLRARLKTDRTPITDLGISLGRRDSAVYHRLNGRTRMSVDELLSICETAGIPPSTIFEDDTNQVTRTEMALINKIRALPRPQRDAIRKLIDSY